MKSICFYFQVHQPFRLRPYKFFDIGNNHYYYDDVQNAWLCRRIADKCYLPTNELLYNLIKRYPNKIHIAYSITGTAIEQFERYTPEVMESFKRLIGTGCVEILGETFHHSLASLKSPNEFKEQVELHIKTIKDIFGVTPRVFRNTELIYSDEIGRQVKAMGFKGELMEGAKQVLGWRSPNFVYEHKDKNGFRLLMKNFQLSDDIAFRFSQQSWSEWPLTADKFAAWLSSLQNTETVNLFMDYETFGEHQWKETGIFDFLNALPEEIFKRNDFKFATPSEVIAEYSPKEPIECDYPVSWADEERDLSAWLGNDLQDDAFNQLYDMEDDVKATNNPDLLSVWRHLQTSDNLYYMCTKWFSDGDVHKYFNHYNTPYEAYINFMNILSDLRLTLKSNKS